MYVSVCVLWMKFFHIYSQFHIGFSIHRLLIHIDFHRHWIFHSYLIFFKLNFSYTLSFCILIDFWFKMSYQLYWLSVVLNFSFILTSSCTYSMHEIAHFKCISFTDNHNSGREQIDSGSEAYCRWRCTIRYYSYSGRQQDDCGMYYLTIL